ncbi:MAG: DUF5333 domain-containing protein [Paracoccaceae bacterium]
MLKISFRLLPKISFLPAPGHIVGLITALIIALSAAPAPAQSLPPLSQEKFINDSLISAAIGELIRRDCSTISAREFRAITKGWALIRYALDLGYSRDEIKAFVDSKTEQNRVEAAAVEYLHANDVVKGNEQSYCKLGRSEIARGTLTGYLLRSRS